MARFHTVDRRLIGGKGAVGETVKDPRLHGMAGALRRVLRRVRRMVREILPPWVDVRAGIRATASAAGRSRRGAVPAPAFAHTRGIPPMTLSSEAATPRRTRRSGPAARRPGGM